MRLVLVVLLVWVLSLTVLGILRERRKAGFTIRAALEGSEVYSVSSSGAFPQETTSPSRQWDDPRVLLALAFILLGAVSLGMLLTPQPPTKDSPEAGFAWDMINHHSQAVEMAEIVRDRTDDPDVRILATDIALTQQAQIGQMQAWLDMWGLPPTSPEPAMSWMGHPREGRMPGMASPEEINTLRDAPSQEADEEFLRLMIPHHQAAVMMAEEIQERSTQPQVTAFAQKTITAQQAEIQVLQNMLESRGSSPVTDEASMPESDDASHHGAEGFFASVPQVAHDTGRLAPLPLAIFAASWLVLDTLRLRRVGKGRAAPTPAPLEAWQAVAVGGLVASAVLHAGLAPSHFAEATAFGVFFSGASVAAAIIAAAILAWPSRLAYVAGAGISIALIVLWGLFRIVPPPGAEAVEVVDFVGLLTKATELIALTACTVLWLQARRMQIRTNGNGGN